MTNKAVSIAEAKAKLSSIVQAAEAGEEIVVTRRGRPVARISAVEKPLEPMDFRRADALRARQPRGAEASARWLRRMRDAARF